MIDYALQRKNMVESQVRPSDITDRRIIRAMASVPRELFVPVAVRPTAYRDEAVAIMGSGKPGSAARVLLSPRTIAALLHLLELGEKDRVLIVGCGTGYSAALLSTIAGSVFALESDAALLGSCRQNLQSAVPASGDRVELIGGPLPAGHAKAAPYDAILIEGAVAGPLPLGLLDQLKDRGRLSAIVAENGVGRGTVWRRSGATFANRAVRDLSAPVLPGFEVAPSFVF